MARRRSTTTQTISAALKELDAYISLIDVSVAEDGAASTDREIIYTFITKSKQRIGCTREQLEGKSENGQDWPVAGDYEIDVVDSNEISLLDAAGGPWRCCHFDKDSLTKVGDDAERSPMGALVSVLQEEARIEIKNQRGKIDAAERRETNAREELNRQIDVCGRLQREKNDAILRAERAIADKELAEGRQKEAEEALAYLESQVAHLEPQMKAAVDHVITRASQYLGMSTVVPTGAANETTESVEEDDSGPAPPGAEDPQGTVEAIFQSTILNPVVCRELVEAGLLKWSDVRAAIWLAINVDVGEVPDWEKFNEAFGNEEAGAA